jgi:hypothetical protein
VVWHTPTREPGENADFLEHARKHEAAPCVNRQTRSMELMPEKCDTIGAFGGLGKGSGGPAGSHGTAVRQPGACARVGNAPAAGHEVVGGAVCSPHFRPGRGLLGEASRGDQGPLPTPSNRMFCYFMLLEAASPQTRLVLGKSVPIEAVSQRTWLLVGTSTLPEAASHGVGTSMATRC